MRDNRGFTLIELMVTVAILAILAAIALPSYTDYVLRGKLPEAQAALQSYAVQLEQYYQDNRSYGTAAGACTSTYTGALKYFSVSCTVGATNQLFTATASNVANVGMGAAGSYKFTIDQSGNKQTTAFTGATVPATCWMLKKNQC
jgi:type IV pilus assembly protein PilE